MSEEPYELSDEVRHLVSAYADFVKLTPDKALEVIVRCFFEMENAITWHTSCTNCAKLLDQLVQADQRWGKAEDKIVELQAKLRGMGAQHGM